MAGYLPSKDGDMLSWIANFQTKIATHGPTLGLTAGEITNITNACSAFYNFIQAVLGAKTTMANAVEAKKESRNTDLKLVQDNIARIKTHPAYTKAIGEDLGIVGSNNKPDLQNERVEISATAYNGYVRIKFKKNGFSGVKIYSRLKGQPGWTFLALDTESPYDDHRPLTVPNQPEEREYYAQGVDGDEEVGLESDIVSVVFGG